MGLRLAGALGIFWYMRGYLSEGRAWLEELLGQDERSGSTVSTAVRAKALNSLCMLVAEQGDHGRAALLAEESMALFQKLGDKQGRATALNLRGNVAKYQSDYSCALDLQ